MSSYLEKVPTTEVNLESIWGTGKFFFLERFHKSIAESHPCVNFNAWQNDYSEDPFFSFFSELHSHITYL
ncbi:MAG: P-loop NTPase fold protein [Leptospirales bacterium]